MRARRTVSRHPLTWILLLLSFVASAVLIGGVASADSGTSRTVAAPSGPEVDVPADATTVTVGFYAVTLQGLDQADNSYFADFFMWMRWRGDRDPTATLELTNNIERWGLTMAKVYDEPTAAGLRREDPGVPGPGEVLPAARPRRLSARHPDAAA